MMRKTGCQRMIVTPGLLAPLATKVTSLFDESESQITIDMAPALDQLFPELCGKDEGDFSEHEIDTAKVCLDDVEMYFHSSGSTGMPKVILIAYRAMHRADTTVITAYSNHFQDN
jgi:acyl-coenzyme A synthetase/AMP-(fatty) acid ligase